MISENGNSPSLFFGLCTRMYEIGYTNTLYSAWDQHSTDEFTSIDQLEQKVEKMRANSSVDMRVGKL